MERISRRSYVAGVAAASTGVAGCLGGGDGGGDGGDGDDDGDERTPVESLPTPVVGDPDADVTVAAYEDFACPHCRDYALEVFPEIRELYVEPGDVRYEHHDLPIPVDDRWSWDAAQAARAVQDRQGAGAYFEFSADLYQNQGGLSYDLVGNLADEYDVDGDAVVEDVQANVYRSVVDADRDEGIQRGVQATPTVFVDGESIQPTVGKLSNAIEAALR